VYLFPQIKKKESAPVSLKERAKGRRNGKALLGKKKEAKRRPSEGKRIQIQPRN